AHLSRQQMTTPSNTLIPYTTLFRSEMMQMQLDSRILDRQIVEDALAREQRAIAALNAVLQRLEMSEEDRLQLMSQIENEPEWKRSEEHTSELQSHLNVVCRLLLEEE